MLPKVHTPGYAIALMFALTTLFALIGNLKLVATISNFCVYAVYLAVNVALIKLRLDAKPHDPGFRVPGSLRGVPILTVLAILSLIYMVIFNLYNLAA